MKTIYLMSGPHKRNGFNENLKESLKLTLKGKKSIIFVASSPDDYITNDKFINGNNKDIPGIKAFISEISDIKIYNILDNRIKKEEGKKILNNTDVIYLLGGNPITQIKYIKENEYDKTLKKFDGVILGTSAGAMNLSKTVYYSKDEDYEKSFFYEGVGLIDITIDPHFDIDDENQLQEAIKNSNEKKIIGIPNASAIKIIDTSKIEFINSCYLAENGIIKELTGEENV